MRRHGRLREGRGRRLDGRSLPVWGDVRIFSLLGFSLLRGSGSRASGEPEPRALLGEPPGKGSESRTAAGRASPSEAKPPDIPYARGRLAPGAPPGAPPGWRRRPCLPGSLLPLRRGMI